MKLNITRVPLSTLAAFLVAVAAHPHSDGEVLGQFAGGLSKATAKRTLPTLIELGLVSKDNSGKFTCNAPEVTRGTKPDDAILVIKQAMHNFRPFEAVCEGLALGEVESIAVQRASLNLGLDDRTKLSILIGWGVELGILQRIGESLQLAPQLQLKIATTTGKISSAKIDSEAAARLFNASQLGRGANQYLDEQDRTLLAKAQLSIRTNPEEAVEKSGKALEDYLREIATTKGFAADAKGQNGAGQLGSMLVGKGVIHSHHNQLIAAISTVRNMKAHHKDKKTMMPWHVTEAGAEWAVFGTLQIIRSVHGYVFKGDQIL
jgi:hypothetical protein